MGKMKNYFESEFNSSRVQTQTFTLTPPLELMTEWKVENIHGHQYVYQNRVLVMDENVTLKTYNINGKIMWGKRLRKDNYRLGISEGMLLFDNDLVICNIGDNIVRINVENGKMSETFFSKDFDLSNSIITSGIFIYHSLNDDDDFVCNAVKYNTGDFLWSKRINHIPHFITSANQKVLLVEDRGKISCFDVESGEKIWEHAEKINNGFVDILSISRIFDDSVYLNFTNNKVLKLRMNDGYVLWEKYVSNNADNLNVYPDGKLYLVDYNSYICVDAENGKIIRNFPMLQQFQKENLFQPTQLCVSDTHLFLGGIKTGKIVAINKENGNIDWSFSCKAGIPLYNFMQIKDEKLFVTDSDGNLYVFREIK